MPPRPLLHDEAPLVECSGWATTAHEGGCLFVWSGCSDGNSRQVACAPRGDHQECQCVFAGAQISSFDSPGFCALGGQNPTAARAIYTEAGRDRCGWRLGPEARSGPP